MTRTSSATSRNARRRRLIAAALVATVVLPAGGRAEGPQWLLRAGGLEVPDRSLVFALGVRGRQLSEEQRADKAREQLGNLRTRLLLAAAALRDGLGEDPAVVESLAQFRRQFLVDVYVAETVDAPARELAGESRGRLRSESGRLWNETVARARKEFPASIDEAALAAVARGEEGDPVVATVAGGEIRADEVRRQLARMDHPSSKVETAETLGKIVLDPLLARRALAALAEREGFARRDDFAEGLADRRLRVLADRYADREVYPAVAAPSEEAVAAHYERVKDRMKRGEEREVFEILLPDEETARAVAARLAEGASFADEARASSVGTTREQGGRLGFFQKGELPPPLDAAVRGLAEGQVSAPVKTQYGWHILRCASVVTGRVPPLEEARPAVEADLVRELREAAVAERAAGLEREIPVEVNEKRFREIVEGATGR